MAESLFFTMDPSFYPTYTKTLEDSTQTLELTYISWACACANWAIPADVNIDQNTGKLSGLTIFVEPSENRLVLPDTIGYSADLVRFTGQFYKEKGYPKGYKKTEEPVERARVFRYTSYSVLRSNYREFVSDPAGRAK